MDIQGKWRAFGRFAQENDTITVTGDRIMMPVRDLRSDTYAQQTLGYTLQSNEVLLRGAECHDIKLEGGRRIPELVCFLERLPDREIPVICSMTMEYDGRGLIVMVTYYREQDLPFIPKDHECELYRVCNKRSAVPMTANYKMPAISMPPFGMMGVQNGMTPLGQIPGAPQMTAKGVSVDPWDCVCGRIGNTGKFCPECGMPMPKKAEPQQ